MCRAARWGVPSAQARQDTPLQAMPAQARIRIGRVMLGLCQKLCVGLFGMTHMYNSNVDTCTLVQQQIKGSIKLCSVLYYT
jgi:hypothetical protein